MDMVTQTTGRTLFRDPKRYFASIDASLTGLMVSVGVDVAMVLEDGVIKDIALGNPDLVAAGCEESWRGAAWGDIVVPDSVTKVEDLLQVRTTNTGKWREMSLLTLNGQPIPIRFTTVSMGEAGRILALGHDLRTIATLQQRLLATHQDLEREYASLRDIETRYRSLFSALAETVVILESNGKVAEMNPAAMRRFGVGDRDPRGNPFRELIVETDHGVIDGLIERALATGSAEAADVGFAARGSGTLRATAFREERRVFLIIRSDSDGGPALHAPLPPATGNLRQVMSKLPDGLVITTGTLRILSANENIPDHGAGGRREKCGGRTADKLARSVDRRAQHVAGQSEAPRRG